MLKLNIAWVLPNTLYLHGERGNIEALKRICSAFNIEAIINKIDFEDNFSPMDYDIILIPPGSTKSYTTVVDWLKASKDELVEFIESGRPLLVTGTSTSLFGEKLIMESGDVSEGLGILNAYAIERDIPYGDDIYYTCTYSDNNYNVIGNQIQMVDIIIEEEEPFGNIIYGYGNNGKDLREGILRNNSIFTNTLGPMLVDNPWITTEIIRIAAETRGETGAIKDLDLEAVFALEYRSFEAKKEFILDKKDNRKTNLRNCYE